MWKILSNGVAVVLVLGMTGLAGCGRQAQEQAALPVITAQLTYAPQVPPPVTRSGPARVIVNLEAVEQTAELAPGVTYNFWTYNGHVPGPFIRVRVGDVVEVHLKNTSRDKTHTVDFHAVSGPGGGAPVLMANPGGEAVASFKMLQPGLYIYHCAANPVPAHIASGLYGLLLVEPEGGMEKADREFYVMQSEFYTEGPLGQPGFQPYSSAKASAETPEYVVFNGRVGSLTGEGALKAKVGDRVRIFFGNIGPNKISSFHVIGGIFERVYREGGFGTPEQGIQTTLVPAGGAVIVEFQPKVPGRYTLVDHSIFRIERGAIGYLDVSGPEAPEIYHKMK
jgi:nitrite reductase (NO-forming)